MEDAVANGIGKVQPTAFSLQSVDHAQTLLVVAKAGKSLSQGRLAGVPERGVTEVVSKGDRLDEVLVQAKRAADGARDLGHFEGVGEACAIVIASRGDEDLGLVHEAAKALRVEHPIAIPLEGRA
jgi:hypothetical protein